MRITALLISTMLAASTPVFAQTQTTPPPNDSPDAPRTPLPYDRGYDKPSARTDAINDAARPGVQAANNAVLATSSAPTTTVSTAAQAQYEADLAEYRAQLRAQNRAANADAAFAARQERAYADAMTAWRIQVADCRAGVRAACRAPSPRPADFW